MVAGHQAGSWGYGSWEAQGGWRLVSIDVTLARDEVGNRNQ